MPNGTCIRFAGVIATALGVTALAIPADAATLIGSTATAIYRFNNFTLYSRGPYLVGAGIEDTNFETASISLDIGADSLTLSFRNYFEYGAFPFFNGYI